MKFNELLDTYEVFISRCRRLRQQLDSQELHGYLQGVVSMFRNLKLYCDDYQLQVRPVQKGENFKKKLAEGVELEGVLDYRDYHIPIYCDDYGQQIIGYWEGKELPGGSYNMAGEYDIADQFDDLLLETEFDF